MSEARIDKWLWCVRIFKTRTIATEACKKGRVQVNGIEVKASKDIKPGDIIVVRKSPVNYTFKVIAIPKGRIGAKLLPDFLENITSPEELQKLQSDIWAFQGVREKGTGRPTKKDRRILENIMDSAFDDWDED